MEVFWFIFIFLGDFNEPTCALKSRQASCLGQIHFVEHLSWTEIEQQSAAEMEQRVLDTNAEKQQF